MSRRRTSLLTAMALAGLAAVPLVAATPALATDAPLSFQEKIVYVRTMVGPTGDVPCDIYANLYIPAGVDAAHPAPAIMTTNGFGGSKDSAGYKSNDSAAQFFAGKGYVTLSYSGLGFGGSDCNIQLDDPDWDGRAAQQLIDFLAGTKDGSTIKGGATNIHVDYVQKDKKDHNKVTRSDDPRVGMIGLSYGGAVQLTLAGMDPRLDAIIPQITWNDLSYSLAPNNTSLRRDPVSGASTVTYDTPGTLKAGWTGLFFALGATQPAMNPNAVRPQSTCPGFDSRACTANGQMLAQGYPNNDTLAFARHASTTSFIDKIKIPTFLSQGQGDTLFNLQESISTYRSLKARKVPVKMVWQQWGHSTDTPAAGELDFTNVAAPGYLATRYTAWFDKYLREAPVSTGPEFEYFRDYAPHDSASDARDTYASAASYPTGTTRGFTLSGSGDLLAAGSTVVAGSSTPFASPGAGVPESFTEVSAVNQTQPVRDAPGSFAAFTSAPLTADVDQVGTATLTVSLNAPTVAAAQSADPGTKLVLFAKLYDLDAAGGITLPHRLISPVRVTDVTKPVVIELPGVVHRYPAGHRIQVVLATSDAAYKGNSVPTGPITVVNSPTAPNSLSFQEVSAAAGPATAVPEAPIAVLLPLVAGGLGAVTLRRRAGSTVQA